MEISDTSNILIAVVGIILMILNDSYIFSLIGMICVSLPFLVLALLGSMGMGDVKLMAAVGLMKIYFCVIKQYSSHTGKPIGMTSCVVSASDKLEARDKAFKLCGGDNSSFEFAKEIDIDKSYCFTVYKSEM